MAALRSSHVRELLPRDQAAIRIAAGGYEKGDSMEVTQNTHAPVDTLPTLRAYRAKHGSGKV